MITKIPYKERWIRSEKYVQLITSAPDLYYAVKMLLCYFEEADDFCTKDTVQDETNPYWVGLQAIKKIDDAA